MYPVDEDENFIQNISKNISLFFKKTCISFTLKPLKNQLMATITRKYWCSEHYLNIKTNCGLVM